MIKNNITRFLDAQKISYTALELPAEKLGAEETASFLGVPLEQVFKTIVVAREGQGKPILAIVPGTGRVDLKALAHLLGEKKLHIPTEREVEKLTGMQTGGVSPPGLIHRGFQMVLDRSAERYESIYVSGGQRGLNIRLPVNALVELIHPLIADICQI